MFHLLPSGRDGRDHLYCNVKSVNSISLPRKSSNYVKNVFDQGQIGSCGWNAIVYAMMADNYRYGYSNTLSRLYGYAKTKQFDGINQEGIRLRDGLDVAVKQGTCLESLYPYTDNDDAKKLVFPSTNETIDADARIRKCKGYARLNTVSEVKAAINNEGGAIIVLIVTDGFLESEKTGFIGRPSGRVLGAHGMYISDYDDDKEIKITYTDMEGKKTVEKYIGGFKLPNSYGREWGEDGFVWIPYDCFDIEISIPFVFNLITEAWTLYDLPKEPNPNQEKIIELQVGCKIAKVNGQVVPLDVEPRIENGRVLVPVRFVNEAIGKQVDYDAQTKKITIRG